jgi:hypothetical protein
LEEDLSTFAVWGGRAQEESTSVDFAASEYGVAYLLCSGIGELTQVIIRHGDCCGESLAGLGQGVSHWRAE